MKILIVEDEIDLQQSIATYLQKEANICECASNFIEGSYKASVSIIEKNNINLKMDKVLADVLLSNLITNAIKYTQNNGIICIHIEKSSIEISNSGNEALTDSNTLFKRFYKVNKSSQSLGLGLAIVNKICNFYNYSVYYNYNESKHFFTIEFK